MKLFVFSSPEQLPLDHEIPLVQKMCSLGLESFHLRKPKASRDEIKSWIELLPEEFHSKIVLHSSYDLAAEFQVQGVHLSQRARSGCIHTERIIKQLKSSKKEIELSTSFHDLSDLRFLPPRYDYVFLTPIFSWEESKEEVFAMRELEVTVRHSRSKIVAHGGLNGARIKRIAGFGFYGVALLRAIWEAEDPLLAYEQSRSVVSSK